MILLTRFIQRSLPTTQNRLCSSLTCLTVLSTQLHDVLNTDQEVVSRDLRFHCHFCYRNRFLPSMTYGSIIIYCTGIDSYLVRVFRKSWYSNRELCLRANYSIKFYMEIIAHSICTKSVKTDFSPNKTSIQDIFSNYDYF